MHLHANHELLHSHHLVNTVVSCVLYWVSRGKALRHPIDEGFSHVLGNVPIIRVAVRSLGIFD